VDAESREAPREKAPLEADGRRQAHGHGARSALRDHPAARGPRCSLPLRHVAPRLHAEGHYHKGFTETYYFLEGDGQIELDGKLYPAKPGMAVMIRPGTRHRAVMGKSPMKILNIVVPPFDAADEWFD
jgi:mannose-6-phosphate isomerase-like protein (cupin superfamily)